MGQASEVNAEAREAGPDIDAVLGDYSRERVADDPTGMAELFPILGQSKQVYDVAKLSGFSETQAMTFARDYFTEILRHAAAQAQ